MSNIIQLNNYSHKVNLNTINQSGSFNRSDKYQTIKTIDALKFFENHGFTVTNYNETKPRSSEKIGFQKHIIRLASPDFTFKGLDSRPEIVIQNSHDGSSAFKLLFGVYRMVCSNGLMVGKTYQGESIRHVGDVNTKLNEALEKIYRSKTLVAKSIESMNNRVLDPYTASDLAYALLTARFNENDICQETVEQSLRVARPEDRDRTLWNVYNRVQEKIIDGGLMYKTKDKDGNLKDRRARRIKSASMQVKINRDLWDIASSF